MLEHVVHVDDDADIREITNLALCDIGGLKVSQFRSGLEFLEAVGEIFPDLILLDVMMPDMSGEETFSMLRKHLHLAKVPIVFMTANGNRMARDRLMELGAAHVIVKPFDPITLADDLRDIWSTRAGVQELES